MVCVLLPLCRAQFVEALAAVAYEAGMQFEDVMVALGCRGANPLTPDGSAVRVAARAAPPLPWSKG